MNQSEFWMDVVHGHAVELRHRQVGDESPVASAIMGFIHATIGADDEVLRVVRVDPDGVVVHVLLLLANPAEGAPTVLRHLQDDVSRIDAIDIERIGEDLVVVIPARLV
jgi:hypothetical protein